LVYNTYAGHCYIQMADYEIYTNNSSCISNSQTEFKIVWPVSLLSDISGTEDAFLERASKLHIWALSSQCVAWARRPSPSVKGPTLTWLIAGSGSGGGHVWSRTLASPGWRSSPLPRMWKEAGREGPGEDVPNQACNRFWARELSVWKPTGLNCFGWWQSHLLVLTLAPAAPGGQSDCSRGGVRGKGIWVIRDETRTFSILFALSCVQSE
jgi:hypothetical protein